MAEDHHTYDGATALLDAIWSHPLYREHAVRLAQFEADRPYCRHGVEHLLDVARIAWIENLERDLGFSRAVIYAAALLHDIGKDEQYASRRPHEEAGAEIAALILADVAPAMAEVESGAAESAAPVAAGGTVSEAPMQLSPDDCAAIVRAVAEHRRCPEGSSELGRLLYRADKASRACFACCMRGSCSWSEEKMNLRIGV